MAIAALFGALALFWLSTRQYPIIVRAGVWIGGAGLLAWSAFGNGSRTEFGLSEAIVDAWVHRANLGEAAAVQAFNNNAVTVTQFMAQLSDFFIVAGIALGALSLLAFTRGERLERGLRPTILAMVGFVAGCAATLAIVAIGLGGQVRPRTYVGYVSERTLNDELSVHDGDTFQLGEVSLRLWGLDAPELDQICRGLENCGVHSRDQLASFLEGALVQCNQERSIRSGRLTESFGRPLVQCWRIQGGDRTNVAAWMIENGLAARYQDNDRYGFNDEVRHGSDLGVMRACSLRPDVWRSDREARRAFEAGATPSPEQAMGHCSPTN